MPELETQIETHLRKQNDKDAEEEKDDQKYQKKKYLASADMMGTWLEGKQDYRSAKTGGSSIGKGGSNQ